MAAEAGAVAYDPNAAMAYAREHWNDGVGVCDQFVKACLAAGGVNVYAGDVEPVKDALLDAGYGTRAQQLTIHEKGVYILESENEGKTAPGT